MTLRSFLLPKPGPFVARFAVLAGLLPVVGWIGGNVWPLDLFNHFQVQYAAVLLLCTVVLLCLKSWRLALLAFAFLMVPLVRIAPLLAFPAKTTTSPTLRFATYNVLTSNTRYEDAVRWIQETDPDVIFLPEVDEEWGVALGALKSRYPHIINHPVEGNFGFAFYSKLPILSRQIIPCGQLELPLLKVKLKGPSGDFIFFGAHPVPPGTAFWTSERDLFLGRIAEESKDEPLPVILAGDLNATRWSHGMKPVFRVGFQDSAGVQAIGGTWMRGNPLISIPIDHVLYRGPADKPGAAVCRSHQVGPGLGSDHRPVVAEIGW